MEKAKNVEYLNGKRKGKEYDYNGNLNYEEE